MPRASSVSFVGGIASSAPTARILPSLMATLASTTLSGDTTLPPRMTRSAFVIIASSEHRPAAIDRQVRAGDLARGIACKKQASIGHVVINRDPLHCILGGVAFCGLLDRD